MIKPYTCNTICIRIDIYVLDLSQNARIDFPGGIGKGAVTIENIEKDNLSRIKYLIKVPLYIVDPDKLKFLDQKSEY